jgi:cytochrome c2
LHLALVLARCVASGAAFAAGGPVAGKAVFAARCSIGHSTDAGVNEIGSNLRGIVGRPSAN